MHYSAGSIRDAHDFRPASLLFGRRRLRRHLHRYAPQPAAGFPTPPSTTSRISTTAGRFVPQRVRREYVEQDHRVRRGRHDSAEWPGARYQEPVQLLHRRSNGARAGDDLRQHDADHTQQRPREQQRDPALPDVPQGHRQRRGRDHVFRRRRSHSHDRHEHDSRPRLGFVGGGRNSLRRQQQHERHGAVFDYQRRLGEQPRLRLADPPADRFQRHVSPQSVRPQRQPAGPFRHVQRRNAHRRFPQQCRLQLARPGQLCRRQQRAGAGIRRHQLRRQLHHRRPRHHRQRQPRVHGRSKRRRPRVSVRQFHRLGQAGESGRRAQRQPTRAGECSDWGQVPTKR